MYNKSLIKVLIIILCLVLLRGFIYGLIIPPNQYPDELYHFALIKSKQLELNHTNEQERKDIAARVAYSFYYLRNPESTRERTLDEFRGTSLLTPPSSLQIYYLVVAWIVKIASLEQISSEFYLSRSISIICGMLVVFIAFLSAWELFPERPFIIIGAPTFITFIPQFSAMNGAINNDKFAEVFAAISLFLMIKMFKHGMQGRRLNLFLALLVMIALAILSKRSTLFMLPVLLGFLFVYWWRASLGLKMHIWLFVMFASIAVGGFAVVKNVSAIDNFVVDHILWLPAYKILFLLFRPEVFSLEALKHYLKFFTVMYWSFWGVFGYMTIHLHHFWYVLAACVQCFSIGGLLRFVRKVKTKKCILECWKAKTLYLFAVSVFFAIIIPFLRSSVLRPGMAVLSQGRYLFPVLIPISILTVLGIFQLLPLKYHRSAGIIGVLGLLLLDSVCLSNYILLNFHLVSLF